MNTTLSKPSIFDIMHLKGSIMPALNDLTGNKFGKLYVLDRSTFNKRNKPAWVCKCECGNIINIAGSELRNGDTKSCGCLKKNLKIIDLVNKKFGKLLVVDKSEKRGKSSAQFWNCICECGKNHIASSQHLRLGQVKSCGCWFEKPDEILLNEAKERFFSNVEKTPTCWIWKGPLGRNYGRMFYKKNIFAHRFSYLIHKGELIKTKLICHTCDNTKCVNPDHLYQGTSKDNSNDAYSRNRMITGENHHYAKLKKDQVIKILLSKEKGVNLASKYNVSKTHISRIKNEKSWKNLSYSVGGGY